MRKRVIFSTTFTVTLVKTDNFDNSVAYCSFSYGKSLQLFLQATVVMPFILIRPNFLLQTKITPQGVNFVAPIYVNDFRGNLQV